MRTWTGVAAWLLTLVCLSGAGEAWAQTVYTFQATGSGSLNGVPFASKSFTIQATANNSTFRFLNPVAAVVDVVATLNIDGFATATFTEPLWVYNVAEGGQAGFGRHHADLFNLRDPAFESWNLLGSVGPVFEANPGAVSQFQNVSTTQGASTFTSINNMTFAAVGADTSAVPEPSAALLFLPALAAVGILKRRRAA